MANIDKNIVITPNISNTSEPKIVFTGGNNNPTTLRVLDDGTLSFEGGAGQLFSISNTATGQIFAVNDISGYPLSEVYSNGFISLARSYGKVVIGNNTAPAAQMTIQGNSGVVGLSFVGQGTSNTGFMVTPAGVRFVSIGGGELALLSLAQLRFSDSTAYSYDVWGGIRYVSANNTMIIGGPGAPGISNNNVISSNVIMHNASTGNFMVANSSATNLFVGANGNIGISNSSPQYTLSVQGTARIDSTVSIGGQGPFSIDAPNISYGRLMVTTDPTGNATNGSPNANVGIGVAAPVYKLQVNGAVGFVNSSATQTLFASNGNVGIGNTTPATVLVVERSDNTYTAAVTVRNPNTGGQAQAILDLVSDDGNFRLFKTSAAGGGIAGVYVSTADPLVLYTNTVARVHITAGGNVGIGNTTPADKLVIDGNLRLTEYTETAYVANSGTAITLALTNGTVQVITLTGTATITMPTAVAGKSFVLYLKQDATGSRTVTWTTVKWPGGTAPTITSTASKQDIFSFFSDGTSWFGATVGQNYTP